MGLLSSGRSEDGHPITRRSADADSTAVTGAIVDASPPGNFYLYGALITPKTVNNGDAAPSFAAGALDFALA